VIAKLRDEHDHAIVDQSGLPPFDLTALEMQVPSLHRPLSNESPMSTPLSSPMASQFSDTFPPTSDPSAVPRSVPTAAQNGFVPQAAFAQSGIHFPASWQIPPSELLQFQSQTPPASAGYMSVNDLAQQIFHNSTPTPPLNSNAFGKRIQPSPPKLNLQPVQPSSFEQVLTSVPTTVQSPTITSSASSPQPAFGPKYLYRSNSSNYPPEPRLESLAAEVGMSAHLLSQCVKQFFRHVYAIRPFIHERSFMSRLTQPEDISMEEKVLILSMCAVTSVHDSPETELPLEKKLQLGKQFLEWTIQMRKNYDWIEHGTVTAIQTSYFIAVALFELKKPRSHHFYLREAVGMAYDQGLHLDSAYVGMSEIQAICARRTFAILFITERGLAILRNKPASITNLPLVPSEYFDEKDRLVMAGFTALASLFSVLDEKFVDLWRSSPGDGTSTAPLNNIAGIQHSLNEISFDGATLTDVQKADVFITHHWLRLIFWQASMRQGLVSYDATDSIFFYDYPIRIAKDICIAMNKLTLEAIMVHGLGIFEKIFEVAYTLMDALTLAQVSWSDSEELRYLFGCLSASPNSQTTYVKMLETKMDTLQSPVQSPNSNTS
jgi:Fungal specific transcription factor domain